MSSRRICVCGKRGRVALEDGEHRQLLVVQPGLGRCHLRAGIGAVDDEAFRLEPANRLPHRDGADLELGRQRVDHHAIAGAVGAAQNSLRIAL